MHFIGAAVQVHELLQETAASITLRPFVTPCSAAVRAQHLEYAPKSPKKRFWELLATIWHRFGAARSNLHGF
mgnify:CR=1 FL=1